MNENIYKSIYTLVVFLAGVCVGYFVFNGRANENNRHYRAELERQQQERIDLERQYKRLELENQQLTNDMEFKRVELSSAVADMEQAAGNIGTNNRDALAAVAELRKVQKQIQDSLLDSGGDNGTSVRHIITEKA